MIFHCLRSFNHDLPTIQYSVALLLSLSFLIYFLGRAVFLVYFHPLRNVPGPTYAKLTNWWQGYYAAKLQRATKIHETHLKYGDIIRVGPNEVSISNPGHLKAVYGHGVPVLKTDFYVGGTFTGIDNIFTMRLREQHASRRKLMSRNFAQAPLMELVPQFLKKTEILCYKLESLGPGTVNLYNWLHRLGLEFIIMQTLGYDPKLTDNDTHHPALRELEVFPENFAITALFPFLKTHGVNVPVASFNKPFRLQAGWVKLYCLSVVKQQRLKDSKDKSPWIRRMTEGKDEFLGRPLEDLEVSEEIVSTLFAGSGTTSATLAFLVYAVIADKSICSKLKDELRQAIPDWPSRSSELPAIGVLQKLPYLNAVISESLRKFPTIPGLMPRKVVAERLKVGNLMLPKDTVVSAQNYSVHMNEEYFPSPEKFDPGRFLGDSTKAREGLNAFSEGPRGCLGRNLAMLELQIVTALFFRYFDVKLDPSMKEEDMVMKVIFSGSPVGGKVLLNLQKDVS